MLKRLDGMLTYCMTALLSSIWCLFCRVLQLVAEAEPTALQPLETAAIVIQKFWRGLKVTPTILGDSCFSQFLHCEMYPTLM